MEKIRLDVYLEKHGMAHSRNLAQRLVMAGQVRVNGQVARKPAVKISDSDKVELLAPPRFVSRGGEKLLAALTSFNKTTLTGKVCVDVGASTGGFTDCLLQHGAERVYAVDVGYGILDWKIRNDPRVVVMERQNARYVQGFPERIDLVVVDASFISLRTLLPVVRDWFGNVSGEVIPLIKPQFEAGREQTARGSGVIRDPEIHKNVLREVLTFAEGEDYEVKGLIKSSLTGPKGNIEFLARLICPKTVETDIEALIETIAWPEKPAEED